MSAAPNLAIANNQKGILPTDASVGAMEAALALGDLSKLTASDRLKWVGKLCESTGLNPLTKPFEYITLQGKLTLYANKGCAEQLRQIHGISIEIERRERMDGIILVQAKGITREGRFDTSLGCIALPATAAGDILANAMMKAETKAKRRVTLSLCGLGFMPDETELETIADVKPPGLPASGDESAADKAERFNKRKPVDNTATAPEAPAAEESPFAAEQDGEPAAPWSDLNAWRIHCDALAKARNIDPEKFDKKKAAALKARKWEADFQSDETFRAAMVEAINAGKFD